MSSIPVARIRRMNDEVARSEGEYVLYWMTAYRRMRWNFSLQRAVEWCRDLKKPLLIFEALRSDYRWASDRLHQFVIQGMADNAAYCRAKKIAYYPYLELEKGKGKGLLAALAGRACVVVGDEFPCFFLPRMAKATAARMPVRFELVDSNGIFPLRATDKVFARAYDFRRFLQSNLRGHLDDFPYADPLNGAPLPHLEKIPKEITDLWPECDPREFVEDPGRLQELPIDHDVPVCETSGGTRAAEQVLKNFLNDKLSKYAEDRSEPGEDVASGLSPYLHFGHISVHQIFTEVMEKDGWEPGQLADNAKGQSRSWWGASPAVEAFLDELITWREVGYNMCHHRDDYDQYESLPDWARETLEAHADDEREHVYSLDTFETAETHDEIWNAAQRQLLREGRIHNYLRMLWGKKIFEWSATPRDALEVMIELNNKYALDGRNPNSYSGIFWCLGRYDRAWGPERPIYGKIRYMTSENTAKKFRLDRYLERYAAE